MGAISEKIMLLGSYDDIPTEITLKSMPTASELDYVGSEDFDEVMLNDILPKSIVESSGIDFRKLYEVDYYWICRGLRMLNYGPYHTTNSIFCDKCGEVSHGEYQVNLMTIPCVPIPEGFRGTVIDKYTFLEFDSSIAIRLLTIQDRLNINKDKQFKGKNGMVNRELGRLCYMISSVGNDEGITPVQAKIIIQDKMSPADYAILKEEIHERINFGLRAGGSCTCPKCGNPEASFIAIQDDRFFRPTLGDLRKWRDDRNSGEGDSVQRRKKATV